jgi:hypothetical protein
MRIRCHERSPLARFGILFGRFETRLRAAAVPELDEPCSTSAVRRPCSDRLKPDRPSPGARLAGLVEEGDEFRRNHLHFRYDKGFLFAAHEHGAFPVDIDIDWIFLDPIWSVHAVRRIVNLISRMYDLICIERNQ